MFGIVKQARSAFLLLKPEEIRRKADEPVHIGLVADGSAAYAEMEDFLLPEGGPILRQVHRANEPAPPANVHVVIYEPGLSCPQGSFTFRRGDPSATVMEILAEKGDLAIPLARQFPVFRHAAINGIIHELARENALFAIATALPNIVPNVIELPWALGEFASDTAFLTANQVRMAFQIAAACGKEVGLMRQKGELLGIAGGALGWRALARELVSHIPLGGGLIPKGAIAYAGTYLTGKGLELLHSGGALPSKDDQKRLYKEGLERGRFVAGNRQRVA